MVGNTGPDTANARDLELPMNYHDYRFSVLRVVPNAMRGERVNIGLAAFHPTGKVTFHLSVNRDRLRALDPNLTAINWETWGAQAEELFSKLPEAARLQWLRTSMAPVTCDAELGLFRATPGDFALQVEDLLERLVLKPRRLLQKGQQRKRQPTQLQAQLKSWFKAEKIMGKGMDDITKHRIVEEYPISLETDSFADFAFKNGALHIMETLDLRNIDHLTNRIRNQAAFKSIVLDQARDVIGHGQRIAIVAATDYLAVKPALKMIERNADDLISMDSQADIDRLVKRLTDALHLSEQLAAPTLAA